MSGTILTRLSVFAMQASIASRQFKELHHIWKDRSLAVCYVGLSLRRTAAKLPILVLQFFFTQIFIYSFNFKASSLGRLNFIEYLAVCAGIAGIVCLSVLIVLVGFSAKVDLF